MTTFIEDTQHTMLPNVVIDSAINYALQLIKI